MWITVAGIPDLIVNFENEINQSDEVFTGLLNLRRSSNNHRSFNLLGFDLPVGRLVPRCLHRLFLYNTSCFLEFGAWKLEPASYDCIEVVHLNILITNYFIMKKNMGGADRILRIILALIVAGLYYYKVIDGTLAYVLLALAAVFVLTSFISFCPLYGIFGLNTCKVKK